MSEEKPCPAVPPSSPVVEATTPRVPASSPPQQAPIAIVHGQAALSGWLEKDLQLRAKNRAEAQAQADADIALHRETKDTAGTASALHTADMGRPTTHPVAVIEVVLAGGRRHQFLQCDLTYVAYKGEEGLQLNLVCPACVARGIPQADAQICIHEKNKSFSVDLSTKGELWADPDTGDVYTLAGTVDLAETSRCPMPGCRFAFRISPNGPQRGVSRLIKE